MKPTNKLLNVKYVPIASLSPYKNNARTHSEEQINQIAASIKEFGWTNPVLTDGENGIIAGHGRIEAARLLGMTDIPTIELSGLTDAQRRAYIIADNKLAENAGWDEELLKLEFAELTDLGFDLELTGFSLDEIDALVEVEQVEGKTDPDAVPEPPVDPVTKQGDIWLLGKHRVMCGDSTSAADVARLMNGETARLIHADPPYGMGKEADGVVNDNIYGDKLDQFQMAWWEAFRPHVAENGSAYIWGNAPDLWRLWFRGGLADSEVFEFRNEIVWDKKAIPGMKSPELTQYPEASERCLFFQFGAQFMGNINTEDFPDFWEPLRAYLEGEAKAAGIKSADVKRICGCGMYSHWFTKSQFTLIPQNQYKKLQAEYPGHFERSWSKLKSEWDKVKGILTKEVQEDRSYFDNAHDIMRDSWEFSRVNGEDRHGHATPKPVDMMERVMKSSCPPGGIVVEPFGGSGSTLMGAEKTGRICYAMELQPKYVDVIVKRWSEFTGQQATLESTGATFESVSP